MYWKRSERIAQKKINILHKEKGVPRILLFGFVLDVYVPDSGDHSSGRHEAGERETRGLLYDREIGERVLLSKVGSSQAYQNFSCVLYSGQSRAYN